MGRWELQNQFVKGGITGTRHEKSNRCVLAELVNNLMSLATQHSAKLCRLSLHNAVALVRVRTISSRYVGKIFPKKMGIVGIRDLPECKACIRNTGSARDRYSAIACK